MRPKMVLWSLIRFAYWESYNISACKHWPVSFDYVCLATGQVTTATAAAMQAHAWGAHAWGPALAV